jgi:anaerobic selenocysteine-containing dehydrogenase
MRAGCRPPHWPTKFLLDGPGQIKALFCLGGNPMLAWPDQKKTQAALEKLELLVVFDFKMTATAELADFVVAPPLTLEIPGVTALAEWLKYIGVSRGYEIPWAQYSSKVADPPKGADLMDEGEFFFRLAQKLGLQLELIVDAGYGPHVESAPARTSLDMKKVPTVDELIQLWCRDARVPLSEVKKYPHGHLFDQINVMVEPRDPDCTARLELADPIMMRELEDIRRDDYRLKRRSADFPYLLISRRSNSFMNSVGPRLAALNKGKRYNPVCIHPLDMQALALDEGDIVWMRSPNGEVAAVAETDDSLRPGTISIVHGFGRSPTEAASDPRSTGASVSALTAMGDHDPITGMPQLSGIPVALLKAEPGLWN